MNDHFFPSTSNNSLRAHLEANFCTKIHIASSRMYRKSSRNPRENGFHKYHFETLYIVHKYNEGNKKPICMAHDNTSSTG